MMPVPHTTIFPYQLLGLLATLVAILSIPAAAYFYYHLKVRQQRERLLKVEVVFIIGILLLGFLAGKATTGQLSVPFFGKTQGPFPLGPSLPVFSAAKFFWHLDEFDRVDDIARDPNDVGISVQEREPQHVVVLLETTEVLSSITEGTMYNYWTFNNSVPGPFIRVREGDTVTYSLTNRMTSLHAHSVDFHAVTGPGGGAKVLSVKPGETRNLTVQMLNPGLYIYHCASAPSVAAHMAHGQYGLILVEPAGGLPSVDKEFYLVQGELYTRGDIGDKGLVAFDGSKMLDELPTYVVFNGRVHGLNGKMKAEVGDTVRLYVGNGGVAKVSSFHVIGEIFDKVYPEGAIGSDVHTNVQSTIVPAGGSTIVEFTLDLPGNYVIVDHSLARMDRGAWGVLEVTGPPNPFIYDGIEAPVASGH